MWNTISSGTNWTGTIENKAKNGNHYFVQTIISPEYDSNKEISGYFSVRSEITEFVKAKVELDQTFKILNETGSIGKIGGWELELSTQELTWTDETFNLFKVDKVDGQKPVLEEGLQHFSGKHLEMVEQGVSRAAEFGESFSIEVILEPSKNGKHHWICAQGKANYEDGKIVSLYGTVQNIDDRKKAELSAIEQRKKSLENAKLASLGELSAGIAHEINNPLTVIKGLIHLFKRNPPTPESFQKDLEALDKSSERINRIVNGLQRYTRKGSGKARTLKDIYNLLEESLVLTNLKAKTFDVDIKVTFESGKSILCDDIEIEQVFVNLINNAIDAIKEQKEKWIEFSLLEHESNYVLKITDSGNGISTEVAEKLFEPFFTTKEVGSGTGLGLSITTRILKEHDARIEVDTESSNTCFVLTFKKPE